MTYPMQTDLHQLIAAIRAGSSSVEAELERAHSISTTSACKHAFLTTSFSDFRSSSLRNHSSGLPLAGLAVSVKDLFDVAGQITSAGSIAMADRPVARSDAAAVARIRLAGGTIVGRTNMSEFAFSGVGVNPHHGTPVNPADKEVPRVPGGSSSGAAVSVATGAAHVGLGSDTGGSIRIPAALQGLVGFKSTSTLVPTQGTVPLSKTLDTVCAITRSVRDAMLIHEILAARTVIKSTKPLPSYRLAVIQNFMQEGLDDQVSMAFDRTLSLLRSAGANIEEIKLPELDELADMNANGGLPAAESFAWHKEMILARGAQYDPRVRTRILRGANLTESDYMHLLRARQSWMHRIQLRLGGLDAILSPTVPVVAPGLSDVLPGKQRDDAFFRVNALLLRNTSVVNHLDGCALSLPCHFMDELPVGLMVWSTAFQDDTVLNVSRLTEATLAHHRLKT